MTPKPIYTPENCSSAYQLRWSLTLFPHQTLPPAELWLDRLNQAMLPDHVRVLEHTQRPNGSELLLVSTTPDVIPHAVVRAIKGRLQHLLRDERPVKWQRNFRLTSVGDASAAIVNQYVSKQLAHHPLADLETNESMREFQLRFDVDVTQVINSDQQCSWSICDGGASCVGPRRTMADCPT
ncbi:transposase [Stieleria varia]|uniref:Transposase IS200-like domain-containing protein n=1 Tax=Stieleria varia TaxID=2528005 RepID=A0A5C6AWK5_9BACT|nr:transposase [Stieleria varia]TWU04323.1 hypothetical protein Pla52n_23630 [Stieleria varia]